MNATKKKQGELTFEDFKNRNHMVYWWASDLMKMLGYDSMNSFEAVLEKTHTILDSLNIPYYENVIAQQRTVNSVLEQDYKLSRFACYISVMNADHAKPQVAVAQAYFAEQTRRFELFIEKSSEIDRVIIREQLADANKSLASIAKKAGVVNYRQFQNAGYLGLYNCEAWKLAKSRKLKSGTLLEHMGRTELAANLFRVTQTEERIKYKAIKGQPNLEQAHYDIGKDVRSIVIKNSGTVPEKFPLEKTLGDIKHELKLGHAKMRDSDTEEL